MIKDAYDIRSKILHGADLGTKLKNLLSTSASCDDVVGRLFIFILSSSERSKRFNGKELGKYFLDLLLGEQIADIGQPN